MIAPLPLQRLFIAGLGMVEFALSGASFPKSCQRRLSSLHTKLIGCWLSQPISPTEAYSTRDLFRPRFGLKMSNPIGRGNRDVGAD